MADFPGIPTRHISPKVSETTHTSVIPHAIAEAKSTRFHISLFLLAALVCGAYYAGRDAGKGASKGEIELLMSKQTQHLETIARSTESIRDTLQNQSIAITTIDSRLHNLNTEVQVVKSHLTTK